jgi:hypothetical protein
MAIGKWAMWFSGLLFLLIGIGALVAALSPSVLESFVGEDGADIAQSTAWILAASFIPGAFLFFWVGTWFGSNDRGVPSLTQATQMAQASQAYAEAWKRQAGTPGTPAQAPGPTGAPLVDPLKMPTDPTQSGFG